MDVIHHPFIDVVLPLMKVAPDDRILDVGCGDGWACRRLAALAPAGMVVGLDASGDRIREARVQSSRFDNLLYICAAAEENPWQGNFFSHALSVDTIYRAGELAAVLRQVYRVLAPGGRLWVVNQIAIENGTSVLLTEPHEGVSPLLGGDQYVDLLRSLGFQETGWRMIPHSEMRGEAPSVLLLTAQKPIQ